ncbi:MAG: transposase, partial [Acidobacteriota bacterium]
MTRKQNSVKADWKAVMAQDEDFMKQLVQEVLQQVLEAEMDETLQAGKSERNASR